MNTELIVNETDRKLLIEQIETLLRSRVSPYNEKTYNETKSRLIYKLEGTGVSAFFLMIDLTDDDKVTLTSIIGNNEDCLFSNHSVSGEFVRSYNEAFNKLLINRSSTITESIISSINKRITNP